MVVHASIKKGERSQINNLTLHFEGLKKKKKPQEKEGNDKVDSRNKQRTQSQ